MPLNLNRADTVLRGPSQSNELANSNEDASLPPDSFQCVTLTLTSKGRQTDLERTLHMIRSTKLGRTKLLMSENKFPPSRNDRYVKWKEIFYLTNRDNFPTWSFSHSQKESSRLQNTSANPRLLGSLLGRIEKPLFC